jgi:hypothetical protein
VNVATVSQPDATLDGEIAAAARNTLRPVGTPVESVLEVAGPRHTRSPKA